MSGTTDPVLPGTTIGILGSGQLGRMIAIAARRMGYRVHTLSPEADSPTGHVADREVVAAYDDVEAVKRFAAEVDVITFEFENISAVCVDAASPIAPVRPKGSVLHTTQNRLREKTFLADHGFPFAPFRHVKSREELASAVVEIGTPVVLKTAGFGYDGKGQVKIESADDVDSAWESLEGQDAVLEAFIDFSLELSVVAARGLNGDFAHFGVVQNKHTNHILDITTAPADVAGAVNVTAVNLTRKVFEALDIVGVACVEYFLDRGENLIINEIAPRVHNSGHFTFDACVTSQFEQHVRAVCGLPLGSTDQPRPAAMANLVGDLWENGEPNWTAALSDPDVKLHLYGKQEARPGRKMGHLTAIADTREQAVERVVEARRGLGTKRGDIVAKKPLENIISKLEILKKDDNEMLSLAKKAFWADNRAIYPFDLLINAAINRNLALSEGFTRLIEDKNMICAGALLRMNLDTALRVYAGFRVAYPHEFVISVMEGKQIRKMKDKSGKNMTDRHLLDELSQDFPWIESVYENTSDYVHLSKVHIFSTFDPNSDLETGKVGVKIGPRDVDLPDKVYLEAIDAFHESSRILAKYVDGWVFTKDNPEKVAAIREQLENQGIDPIIDI